MKKFAVIGNPIAHSKSPDIFGLLFRNFDPDAKYIRISLDSAEEMFKMIGKYNISGFNVTSPFKEDVFHLLKDTDPVSKKTGAVNLVLCRNGSYYGFNTDVYGIQHALIFNNVEAKDKKCIVLGSGGAAKSAVYALQDLGGDVYICNRTDSKAEKIAEDFSCNQIEFKEFSDNMEDTFLLVSTVSEMSQEFGGITSNAIVLEANYKSPVFGVNCKRYIGGYDWLINQALKSFELFFDMKADLKNIKNELTNLKRKKNIALIGMTGCGKTTFGRIIAEKYRMEFVDTDHEIEVRSGRKSNEIFSSEGEKYFRKLEEEIIAEAVQKSGAVISVGGGALSSAGNREVIRENCYTVLLDSDTDTIVERMDQSEISKRPLLKQNGLKDTIEKMFKERRDHYFSAADFMIRSDTGSPDGVAVKIIKELDGR